MAVVKVTMTGPGGELDSFTVSVQGNPESMEGGEQITSAVVEWLKGGVVLSPGDAITFTEVEEVGGTWISPLEWAAGAKR